MCRHRNSLPVRGLELEKTPASKKLNDLFHRAITLHEPVALVTGVVHTSMSQEKVADTIQSDPIISSTNVNGSPSRRAKKTRVRTGCLQCKRRHVRCDEEGRPHPQSVEEAGQCLACRRLGLECIWPSLNHSMHI